MACFHSVLGGLQCVCVCFLSLLTDGEQCWTNAVVWGMAQ